MAKHECNYLSECCGSEVIYGTEIEFDEYGASGVCSTCHDYVYFHDEGHTPWDDDFISVPRKKMEDHDCEMVSVCCGAYPHFELDAYFTGVCGRCHDGTGFECGVDENCTNNTNAVVEQAYNNRHNEP